MRSQRSDSVRRKPDKPVRTQRPSVRKTAGGQPVTGKSANVTQHSGIRNHGPSGSRAAAAPRRDRRCTAVIADMIGSRRFTADERNSLQHALQQALTAWNARFQPDLLAEFTITTGDEFQGLFRNPVQVPGLIRALETALPGAAFRVGIGFGELYTDLNPLAVGMDGPAWHAAREAIDLAKSGERQGGVFGGFGNDTLALNALARFLHHHYQVLTAQQRRVAELLREGNPVKLIAEVLSIPATNVSRHKKVIGWSMIEEGEKALVGILARFDTTNEWTAS